MRAKLSFELDAVSMSFVFAQFAAFSLAADFIAVAKSFPIKAVSYETGSYTLYNGTQAMFVSYACHMVD